jgi:hypothetical protein
MNLAQERTKAFAQSRLADQDQQVRKTRVCWELFVLPPLDSLEVLIRQIAIL